MGEKINFKEGENPLISIMKLSKKLMLNQLDDYCESFAKEYNKMHPERVSLIYNRANSSFEHERSQPVNTTNL